LSSIYGEQYLDDFKEITREYNRLAFTRKPEFMGWGYEWNTFSHGRERPTDTDFSFTNYKEADKRIADLHELVRQLNVYVRRSQKKLNPLFSSYYTIR